ncbi:MAG: Acyl-CoA dehydrogenase [Acidobacteria bacterium ADurb.Bin340]|nr:MAG: Acyl-CoA dehydrogenase [Acidobacteria bacterium ADurb.Bin340]
MPDFHLTHEQQALRNQAQAFARNVIRPVAQAFDRSGDWPEAIIQRAFEAGYLQALVPTEFGGPGLGHLDETLLAEELAWGCAGFFTTLMANDLAMTPLLLGGTEDQKRRWLARLVEAPRLAAFALSEPEAGSDAGAMTCRAERRGDAYVVTGTKCFCTNGDKADWITLFCTTDPGKGPRGISAFIVPSDTPGLTFGPPLDKMGQRVSRQVELHFDGAVVPAAHLLGREGSGFALAMHTLDHTRATVAAAAVGVARAAFELALEHTRARTQFGQPLIAHQAVGFTLADTATRIEASRLLTWQAAWRADRGLPNARASAMAKTFASDAAMAATTDAVQLLGGYGYCRDYHVEKLMRDAKLLQIYEGTNQIQRLVIARDLQQNG